ncbi:MAG: hypothetical protein AB7P69_18270 [Candidatus Binatia bacterium]
MKALSIQATLLVAGAWLSFATYAFAQQAARQAPSAQSSVVSPQDEYGIIETSLPCEEANQIAHRSVRRLGYTVDSFVPATTEKKGLITASRTFVWGDKEPVTVKISCKPEEIDIDARPDVPPCEQANRISRLAVEHLGYEVTEFTPAAVGQPGIVKGRKDGQPEVYITLFCEGRMVTMDTSSDSPLLQNRDFYTALTDFRRGFFATYKAQRRVVVPSAPPSGDQIRVTLRPLSKADVEADLGAEMTTLVAVHVEIINPTKRTYQLDTEKIMLVNISGERAKPLIEKDNAFPVHALKNQSVEPGAQIKGYLYYPVGTYTGARGALIEEKSQEREGFEVPF